MRCSGHDGDEPCIVDSRKALGTDGNGSDQRMFNGCFWLDRAFRFGTETRRFHGSLPWAIH